MSMMWSRTETRTRNKNVLDGNLFSRHSAHMFEKKHTNNRRRRRGEGTTWFDEQRGRWVWQGSVVSLDGSRKRPKVYGSSLDDVLRKAAEWRTQRGLAVMAVEGQTTADYLRWWVEHMRPGAKFKTLASYRWAIESFLANPEYGLAKVPLRSLTSAHVIAWRNGMVARGEGARSTQLAQTVLSMALKDAAVSRQIPANPAADVRGVTVHKKERRTWSAEEVRRFLAVAQEDPLGPLFVVALYLGIRQGELLGMHWDQVDGSSLRITRNAVEEHGRFVQFGTPKSRKSRRTIPILEVNPVVRALVRQRERLMGLGLAQSPLVFPTTAGTVILKSNLHRVFLRLIRKAGVPRISFHDLRHTAGTLLRDAGVDIKIIQEILGHEDITTTANIYLHASEQAKSSAVAQLSDFLEQQA